MTETQEPVAWMYECEQGRSLTIARWSEVSRYGWTEVPLYTRPTPDAAMRKALEEAVAQYGKPGGPWNVPSDPGGWLERARAALAEAPADGEV